MLVNLWVIFSHFFGCQKMHACFAFLCLAERSIVDIFHWLIFVVFGVY